VKTSTLFANIYPQISREIFQHLRNGTRAWGVVWIDLSDQDTEGVFRWGDGALASAGWTNWKQNEPSNSNGNEDCGHLYHGYGDKWNDVPCERRYRALCERPIW